MVNNSKYYHRIERKDSNNGPPHHDDHDYDGGPLKPKGQEIMATVRRLLQLARPERHLMVMSAITMAIDSTVTLSVPAFSGRIIDLSIGKDDGDGEESQGSPLYLLMVLLGIMTMSGFTSFFRIYWQSQAGHRMVARVRRRLYAGIVSQDAAYFDQTSQGDLISRLSSDTDLVQGVVTDRALGFLKNAVVAIGSIALLFYTSVSLALISVAILPPIAICARFVGGSMKERERKVRELHAEATSLAEQALTCITTVQQFVSESFETQQYNRAINAAHAEGIENTKLKALFGSVMGLVVNFALLCVLGYGGMLVSEGKMSAGDLASFVMYSVMMGANIGGVSNEFITLTKAIAAANRVFEIIDREPAIPPPHLVEPPENELLVAPKNQETDSKRRETVKIDFFDQMELGELPSTSTTKMVPMSVDFENVTFSYPTRPESKILKSLNLSVGAGQTLALVGGSGAGKSTITSLLTRLYDPQSGSVKMDNSVLKDMDPQEIRRNVGIVVQEPLLFPTTIEANIRYGSPDATDEEVREAARLAFVLDFADKFPDGLKTVVGPRGTQLSGGQKQRVAVARCILKNPPIVVFDEATSALDAESEAQVQQAIDTACKGRTVIMIAHRLSTIRNADAIAVLRDGQVAELGTFDELVGNRDGVFHHLMEKQLVQ